MLSEKEKAEDFEKRFAEAHRIIEEKQKKLGEADGKLRMLQETVKRLEEKISNVESENKVLRQQAISKSIMHRGSDDGTILGNSSIPALDTDGTPAASRKLTKERSELDEKQQEHHDMLIRCIAENCGFSGNRPVAACIIFKCLLNWGSFEVENTSVFDRIIQTIGHAIETQADNNDVLAYWLSNSSTLLLLLQRTLKPSVAQRFRGIPQAVDLSYVSGSSGGRSGSISHVESKHPALLFKQRLTAYVVKIYGMIRDNLRKEISPSLVSIIQAPKKSRASLLKGDHSPTENIGGQQDLIGHWQDIARSLTNFLNTLKANNVPPFLVRKVFVQIFTFINVLLFNSILLSKELCSLSNGEYVKAGLTELEQWCVGATYEYAGRAYDELKHIRQAIDFFVIHQKSKKTFDEITHDLCPTLSMQQLYRISTSFRDDKNGTHSLARNVIAKLRVLLTGDSYSAGSNQFLLDVDSSVSFSVDDISQSMKQIDISNLEPPPLIRENTSFLFLWPSNQDKS